MERTDRARRIEVERSVGFLTSVDCRLCIHVPIMAIVTTADIDVTTHYEPASALLN